MKRYFFYVLALLCSSLLVAQPDQCKPIDLKCDYIQNPMGIDSPSPRLSWRLQDKRQGAKQTAYQILVGTDSLAVVNGLGNIWNSGENKSDKTLITFAGKHSIEMQLRGCLNFVQ